MKETFLEFWLIPGDNYRIEMTRYLLERDNVMVALSLHLGYFRITYLFDFSELKQADINQTS